jgi:hypothetical protein
MEMATLKSSKITMEQKFKSAAETQAMEKYESTVSIDQWEMIFAVHGC